MHHYERFSIEGKTVIGWDEILDGSAVKSTVELELDYPYAQIHYTTDGSIPTAASPMAPAS